MVVGRYDEIDLPIPGPDVKVCKDDRRLPCDLQQVPDTRKEFKLGPVLDWTANIYFNARRVSAHD